MISKETSKAEYKTGYFLKHTDQLLIQGANYVGSGRQQKGSFPTEYCISKEERAHVYSLVYHSFIVTYAKVHITQDLMPESS